MVLLKLNEMLPGTLGILHVVGVGDSDLEGALVVKNWGTSLSCVSVPYRYWDDVNKGPDLEVYVVEPIPPGASIILHNLGRFLKDPAPSEHYQTHVILPKP